MNPREYQQFAERLVAASSATPAECRAAISRAYYAAFNVAAELLRKSGFAIGKGGGAHGEVRHCLANAADADVSQAASQLGDLHSERNRADYHLDRLDVERPGEARAVVVKAARIIHTLDEAFGGSKAPQIHAAILGWRKANRYP